MTTMDKYVTYERIDKMNIAMMHFRTGETDGVSLEMDKWRYILEKQGHHVLYIAGSGHKSDKHLRIINELHYMNPTNDHIVNVAYKDKSTTYDENKLKEEIDAYADAIEEQLIRIIEEEQIDLIIPNNVLSLGWNLSAGMATARAIEKTGVRAIAHHHDFHWERELYSNPNFHWVNELLEAYFPPQLEQLDHVVINGIAKRELKQRYDLEATIVPNVFDFQGMLLEKDAYNSDIREELGIHEDAVIFLQGTRIVERKGIELAIDVLGEIEKLKTSMVGATLYDGRKITHKTEYILVFAGLNESPEYYEALLSLAKEKGVSLMNVNHQVDHIRKEADNKKIFSLWDAYLLADFITYPSLLEGFGNQFLEAVFAKKPLLIYEYPVFEDYIGAFGFDYVSLGNKHRASSNGLVQVEESITKRCAKEILEVLTDEQSYSEMINKNFDICLDHFSYTTLDRILSQIFCPSIH